MNKALAGLVTIAEKSPKLKSRGRPKNEEREEARRNEWSTYTNKIPCNICGCRERYTCNGQCVPCHGKRAKASYHRRKGKPKDEEI